MIQMDLFPRVEIHSAADLRAWLVTHHEQTESVWLVTWKKAPGSPYVSREEVLDELVAFGWIDGLRRKLDQDRTMQLISPRKQQAWAANYKRRAERLEAEGRMHHAGRAAIAAAMAAGRWDETAEVDALIIPSDLDQAFGAHETAQQFFHAAAPSYRRNVLRWLHGAKRAETRACRIARIVELSAKGEKVPQL